MKSFAGKTSIAAAIAVQQTRAIAVKNLLQGMTLAQTEGGCGGGNIGTPFMYLGPSDHKPAGFADVVPGMNLA